MTLNTKNYILFLHDKWVFEANQGMINKGKIHYQKFVGVGVFIAFKILGIFNGIYFKMIHFFIHGYDK